MKLLAVRLARSIWLMPSYFLNPNGTFLRPSIEIMKTRYNFLKSPLDFPFPPPPNDGLTFLSGAFGTKNGMVQVTSMAMHNDGIVIDTRSSTNDADLFMEDVVAWYNKEFGMPAISDLPVKKIYVSELNVSFQHAPTFFNPKLASLIHEISSAIGDDGAQKADFLSFQLGTDQTRTNRPAVFRIDREVNTRIEENRDRKSVV